MPVLFFAGMELRQKPHQEWLANTLQQHMQENAFPGFLFVLHGCRFAWMKLEGQRSGRFARIKEGAAARYNDHIISTFYFKNQQDLSLFPNYQD